MKHRLVDRILDWQAKVSIRGIKTVSLEEYSLKEPFGEPAHLPESLVLGSIVQLGQWLMVLSSDYGQTGVLSGAQRVSFEAPVQPGDRMRIDIAVREYGEDGLICDAIGQVGQRVCAVIAGCSLLPLPLSSCCDPADLRVLFSEIYCPRGEEP